MPSACPELIFVAGPQEGERAVLMTQVVGVGRSPDADVQLTELYVSRRQIQFQLTHEGWIVENVAKKSLVRINGKKLKVGKKLILDTGDLLSVGMETQILFVAPGDDPEEALAEYRNETPAPDPEAAVAAPSDESVKAEPIADTAPAEDEAPAREEPPAESEEVPGEDLENDLMLGLTDEEREAATKKQARVKKLAMYGGVYLAVLIGAAVLLSGLGGRDRTNRVGVPRLIPTEEISQMLSEPITGKPLVEPVAQQHLQKAKVFHREAEIQSGNLYKAVKHYKLYLAYSRRETFPTPELERQYNQALRRLIREVTKKYKDSYVLVQDHSYTLALASYEELLRMVPAKEAPEPERFNKLFENTIKNITYLGAKLHKEEDDW
jgi:pSer/pThr/pTyr-binding forkhead associated (FHA) protein